MRICVLSAAARRCCQFAIQFQRSIDHGLQSELFYRGDMTKTKWKRHDFKTIVATHDFARLRALLANKKLWGNVDQNRYDSRLKFLDEESRRRDDTP